MGLSHPGLSQGFKSLKNQFCLPQDCLYFCGHSLGPLSIRSKFHINQALNSWESGAVQAWNQENWMLLNYSLGERLAPILGAKAHEVIVSDSTSINLYKILNNALVLNPKRNIILTEKNIFPADLYIAQGIVNQNKALSIQYLNSNDIEAQLNEKVAVLLLSHVDYRSGQMHDLQRVTKLAHEKGILIIIDLSHSVGAMPLALNQDQVDFAVGCTYKYLNGGPGAPSFIFVHERLHSKINSPIFGWIGHQKPFDFSANYQAKTALSQYLGGTPYVMSLKGLEGALDMMQNVDLKTLRTTATAYTQLMIDKLTSLGLECLSPINGTQRANHIALTHPQAYGLSRILIQNGIICDYREPDLIRLSVNPLYQDESDIDACIEAFSNIMAKLPTLNQKFIKSGELPT